MSVETLGDALRADWALTVRCAQGRRDGMKSIRECLQSAKLDLASIVWTRGRNFPISRLGERMMCPRCGSMKVTVAFSPPAPGDVAATGPAMLKPGRREERVSDMNFVIEEWDKGRVIRILAGTPSLDVAHAAFAAAIEVTRNALEKWPGRWIELKHGTRIIRRYPLEEAGERASPAAE